jgi:hypothetical protein
MKIRAALMLFAFVFAPLPAFAQGPPGGGAPGAQGGVVQALSDQIAALTARVNKLEGDIVAADLVGSYTLSFLDIPLSAAVPGVRPATVSTSAGMVTVTLNANGTASMAEITCGGARLIQGPWALVPDPDACEGFSSSPSWTYANGILTLFFDPEQSEGFPFRLAVGGRFGIAAVAPFHPQDPSSDNIVMILSRLR